MSAMVISWGGSVLGVRAGFKGAQGARALGLTPAKSGRAGGGGKCPTFRETAAPGARNEDRSVTETDGRCRATAAQISPRPGVHQPSSMILSVSSSHRTSTTCETLASVCLFDAVFFM